MPIYQVVRVKAFIDAIGETKGDGSCVLPPAPVAGRMNRPLLSLIDLDCIELLKVLDVLKQVVDGVLFHLDHQLIGRNLAFSIGYLTRYLGQFYPLNGHQGMYFFADIGID
jgi:hypothetical protein